MGTADERSILCQARIPQISFGKHVQVEAHAKTASQSPMLMSKSGAFRRLRSSPISFGGMASPRADISARILGGSLRLICSSSRVWISFGRWLFDAETRLNERRLPLVLLRKSFVIRLFPPLICSRLITKATPPSP
jgi:hypothetical protein